MTKFRSLLDELDNLALSNMKIIESKADHIINSAYNLIKLLEEEFPPEQADNLTKRLLYAIKTGDQQKFTKSLKSKKENK